MAKSWKNPVHFIFRILSPCLALDLVGTKCAWVFWVFLFFYLWSFDIFCMCFTWFIGWTGVESLSIFPDWSKHCMWAEDANRTQAQNEHLSCASFTWSRVVSQLKFVSLYMIWLDSFLSLWYLRVRSWPFGIVWSCFGSCLIFRLGPHWSAKAIKSYLPLAEVNLLQQCFWMRDWNRKWQRFHVNPIPHQVFPDPPD